MGETKLGSNLPCDVIGDALVDVDVRGDDGLGRFLGHGLDVHSTVGRGDDGRALRLSIHQDGQVELSSSEFALADVDGIAESSAGTGLLGDELVADHLVGEHLCFRRPVRCARTHQLVADDHRPGRALFLGLPLRVDHSYSSFQTIVKGALPTSPGEDLSLDDHIITTYDDSLVCHLSSSSHPWRRRCRTN